MQPEAPAEVGLEAEVAALEAAIAAQTSKITEVNLEIEAIDAAEAAEEKKDDEWVKTGKKKELRKRSRSPGERTKAQEQKKILCESSAHKATHIIALREKMKKLKETIELLNTLRAQSKEMVEDSDM